MALCQNCFEQLNEYPCQFCNWQPGMRRSSLLLQPGTQLRGQYLVGELLGNPGGFGITYLGYHQKLDCKLAIKEFLPRQLAGRSLDGHTVEVHAAKDAPIFAEGLQQFLREARLLAKFAHPNIVRVIDFFEENGTAYLVMEYYSGVTLVKYVESHGGRLDEQAALAIMLPIFDGLQEVHSSGILHRDIKPQNIYITAKGRPILLDFGAARQAVEALSQGFTMLVTPGFAPIEQYDRQGKQGPWTDVYGCAATLYYMLSGNIPPDAVSRMAKDTFRPAAEIAGSYGLRQAVAKGLALLPQDRPQTVAAFRDILLNTLSAPEPGPTQLLDSTQRLPLSAAETVVMGSDETADISDNVATEFSQQTAVQGQAVGETAQRTDAPLPLKSRPGWVRYIAVALGLLLLTGAGLALYQYVNNPAKQLAKRGITPSEAAFFSAVRNGDLAVVKLLVASGYSSNQAETATGVTAVMAAVEAGHYSVVKYLLSQGASLDAKDLQNRSAIDVAIANGNIDILKLLLAQKQLVPDSKDETGRTLMEKAVTAGNINTVQYFISQGANLQALGPDGKTLLDYALAAGQQQVAQLLRTAGVRRNINQQYKLDALNHVLNIAELQPGAVASFELDLLGNGIGQSVSLRRQNGRGNLLITQEGRTLGDFNKLRGNCYVAFLRNEQTPDLIFLSLVGANFIEEIKIIGKTGQDSVGVLFAPDLGALRSMGLLRGQAGMRLEGGRLILFSGKNRAAVEWDEQQQTYRMRKL